MKAFAHRLVLTAFLALPGLAAGQTPRDDAVLRARAGDVAGALDALRGMIAAGTGDRLVAMDLVTLLQQNGKAAEAVAVFERAANPAPPEYALLAATRAYRDLRRYGDAARLARSGMARFGDPVWPVLLSLALSDSGDPAQALAVLKRFGGRASAVERLLAEAYAWRRSGDRWAALRAYAEALAAAPGNKEARSETAGLLRELRGPNGAAALIEPALPLRADQAGALVRWGADVRPPEPALRFEGTDRAIARLDALIAEARAKEPVDEGLVRRMRLDRMVAYRDRVRMQDVLDEGALLRAEGALPVYVRETLGDAFLYLRQPEAAAVEYDAVLAESPRDENARAGRFYAAIEMEEFGRARADADAMLRDTAIWRFYSDGPARYANPDYPYAVLRAAQVRLWGNQIGQGWDALAPVAAAAPANASLRRGMAGAMAARGWPRAADEEAQIAASLAPNDVGAQIALAELALVRRRLPEARARAAELVRVYPENTAVQRLARDLDAEHRFLLEAEARPSSTSGGGIWNGGKELESSFVLTSPPVGDIWRVFALGGYSYAHPVEGFRSRVYAGAGLELRLPDLTARAYVTQSAGSLSRAGAGASVDWSPTDQVTLGVLGQIFSTETPLRALGAGITAKQVTVSGAWRQDETRALRVTASYLPFSDGNRRFTAGATFGQLVFAVPHFDVTARAAVFGSSNSIQNTIYYNPRADLSVTGGVTLQHVIWRRYENSLSQALAFDAGGYAERGYRGGWLAVLSYEHRWRFDPRTEFHYGVSLSRRPYDGNPEKAVALLFGLRQRI